MFDQQVVIDTSGNIPPWLGSEMAGVAFNRNLTLTDAEQRICQKRDLNEKPSEWAEKNLVVVDGPLAGSKIKYSVTPYARDVLDASFYPSVREITVCAAPQVLKTTLAFTCISYVADVDPGNALIVYPNKDTAKDNCRDRIQPIFEQSPRLSTLLTDYEDDKAGLRIKLKSMLIYMGWAGSATSLGNKPVRYLVKDEKDKFPETPAKNEAGASDLADKRTNTFTYNKKIWNLSTPTVEKGAIWQDLIKHSEVIFEYWVKCPDCDGWQVMVFGGPDTDYGIKFPKDQHDPKIIESDALAWYQCEHCTSQWGNYQRDQAVAKGEWRAKATNPDDIGLEIFKYLKKYNPKKIGFHLPSWVSTFIPLEKVAAAFLSGTTDKVALRDFCNNHKAEPWFEFVKDIDKEITKLRALKDDRPSGRVPGGGLAAALVAGIDTQDNGFYYKINAVGYGLTHEHWLVRKGFVDSLAGLAEILWEHEYSDANGLKYPVHFSLIDSMGHRTAEVYDFCRVRKGRILPTKGQRTKDQAYSYGNLEYYPNSKKIIPGGLKLVHVNTKYFKDQLDSKLNVPPTDPGAYHLHNDVETDDYLNQMTAECLDDSGFWVQIGKRPNHYWDCATLAMVAADISNIKHWPKPGEGQTAPTRRRRIIHKGIRKNG